MCASVRYVKSRSTSSDQLSMPRKEVAMNNRFCSIALALFPLLLGSCGDIPSPEKSVSESSEADSGMEDTMRELITDRNFETGFDLMTTSTENGRTVSRTLDYGGEAKKTESRPCCIHR